jgi:hypothetical protein
LKYDLTTGNLNSVAIVDQSQDISYRKAGEWESSGIIKVFDKFGKGLLAVGYSSSYSWRRRSIVINEYS